ncbi:hypothetical protein BDY17DRAFT_306819 [Neohortaea acidophila]|uniref:ATPase of the ABC class n=1 Tax=Neohortaea acidophila TaxID=245834 RepID=A0A6A6Q629_9PEZI|nr:uncharacterized protein BDY17DRAFT_306819 [Neohortaea acidophila]KAF2487434.1 hypothetical protein BDY17DRAFT_306819 [Neohortaea acidophila]
MELTRRGEYYKNKYGRGGGRGRGRGGSHAFDASQPSQAPTDQPYRIDRDWNQLHADLHQIDGSQYGAYHQLRGQYHHVEPTFTLSVDRVQGDPYAPPSQVRCIMPWQETGLPNDYLASDIRKVAACDLITRVAADVIRERHMNRGIGDGNVGWSGPKGGAFNINSPGQEVLPRTSAMIAGSETIELRFTVSLPAAGRRILGPQAWQILGINLVEMISQSLLHRNLHSDKLREHVMSVERQHALRAQLLPRGLIAFIANGSILPRASGAAALPMDSSNAVPFKSPKEAEVSLTCLDGSKVQGMGIPRGITLLTGGGFHGKSTLLEAIELGIYNHIPGDGRESVVTDPTAVKIRAEDGRSVSAVDISPFIANLPGNKDTKTFSTDDASGSTSMAANIQEAMEGGCKTVLIDEDSSATNLLVRDQRMQSLIQKEPITPLISKAKAMYNEHGVSTIIVIGGLGDWLTVSDNVILMDSYIPRIITDQAKAVVERYPSLVAQDTTYGTLPERKVRLSLRGFKSPHATRMNFIGIRPQNQSPVDDPAQGEAGVDLSGLDQMVEIGQTRSIAAMLEGVEKATASQALPLSALLERMDSNLGLETCLPVSLFGGDRVAVRRLELAAAISRFRGLQVHD